jgi:uncharacterized protein
VRAEPRAAAAEGRRMTPATVVPVASLYVGKTRHVRLGPRAHRFSYCLFQLLIDVDRIEEGLRSSRLFRWGLFSFAERDHGARDGSLLRTWVEARLAEADLAVTAHRIRLLAFPRMLGFVFNPISIFFIEDADGRLEAVIYEVNNTFGQTHAYVAAAAGAPCERQEADKKLYVSPFFGVDGAYRFLVTPPARTFNLVIAKSIDDRPDFIATLSAERRDLTDAALLGLFFTMPLMTLGVVAAIHWQALRLWLKGAPFGARPPGPRAGMSVGRASFPTS